MDLELTLNSGEKAQLKYGSGPGSISVVNPNPQWARNGTGAHPNQQPKYRLRAESGVNPQPMS